MVTTTGIRRQAAVPLDHLPLRGGRNAPVTVRLAVSAIVNVAAIQQIRERQYPNSLLQYTGNILLVAINYDEKTKEHVCKIEEYAKIQN